MSKEKESTRDCSNFIKHLVQYPSAPAQNPVHALHIPRKVVQFWNDLDHLPDDVKQCMDSWRQLEEQGLEYQVFDSNAARDFISRHLSPTHVKAYDNCYHPAMQSDYFRLSYISVEGGFYVDADDYYKGTPMLHLFDDGRLKVQPLCYNWETGNMVQPDIFTQPGAYDPEWNFYFNNNPLIACPGHPIVVRTLAQVTANLGKDLKGELPEIQAASGPLNFTKAIFDTITEDRQMEHTLIIMCDWESISSSKWPLSYRSDSRNWRYSNQQRYEK